MGRKNSSSHQQHVHTLLQSNHSHGIKINCYWKKVLDTTQITGKEEFKKRRLLSFTFRATNHHHASPQTENIYFHRLPHQRLLDMGLRPALQSRCLKINFYKRASTFLRGGSSVALELPSTEGYRVKQRFPNFSAS
ncbi:hypothetical protein TNCV_534371 [Trichonephila clavipes]|nr:hypothetical protein TNCV_534371 [Trichonephila clavipes]